MEYQCNPWLIGKLMNCLEKQVGRMIYSLKLRVQAAFDHQVTGSDR